MHSNNWQACEKGAVRYLGHGADLSLKKKKKKKGEKGESIEEKKIEI